MPFVDDIAVTDDDALDAMLPLDDALIMPPFIEWWTSCIPYRSLCRARFASISLFDGDRMLFERIDITSDAPDSDDGGR